MKKLFSLFIISLFLFSCEIEKETVHKSQNAFSSKTISYVEFINETGLSNFHTSITIPPNSINILSKTVDGNYELTDFDIETDIIKRMEFQQKITYSLIIHPKDTISENFFNLIIYEKDNIWENLIIEMKPTPENLNQLQNGLTDNFVGQMRKLYDSSPPIMSACSFITITSHHCTGCQGECNCTASCCVTVVTFNSCDSSGSSGPTGGGPVGPTPSAPSGSGDANWGNGTSGSTPGPDDIFIEPNLDPTSIHPIGQNTSTPCDELKKLLEEDSNQPNLKPNLKPKIEVLKSYAEANFNHEVAYHFSKNSTNEYSTSNLVASTSTTNSAAIIPGGDVYSAGHSHTVMLYSMFSWSDVYVLYSLFNSASIANRPEVTLILVAKTCITCTDVNVYAIKINNFQQLRNKLNADLSDPNTTGLPLSDKIQFANDQFEKKHSLTMNQVDLEKLFLENFANHQISLYKANDNLTNWSNLTLSSNPIAPIAENPCN